MTTDRIWKTEPYDHQVRMREFMKRVTHPAIFAEQGTGKTKTLIDLLDDRIHGKGMPKVLITCPKTVMTVWEKEIRTHSAYLTDDDVHALVKGSTDKRFEALRDGPAGVYIVNIEAIRTMWIRENDASTIPWDMVVIDESTVIKSPTSKQARAMHRFPVNCKAKRVILTGTPAPQSCLDLWSQFQFLRPGVFPSKFFFFRNDYAVMRERRPSGRKPFQEIVAYQNQEKLKATIEPHAFRITKDECLDLPPKIFQERIIPWPAKAWSVYKELKLEMVAELNDDQTIVVDNVLTKMMKLRQICNGWAYHGEAGKAVDIHSAKLDEMVHVAGEAGPGVIVWVEFVEDGVRVIEALNKAGILTSGIGGATKMEDRGKVIEAFQNETIDAIVCQTSTVQFGATLHRAHTAIRYCPGYSVEQLIQSDDRCHRAGLKHPVTYIDLLMADSIEIGMRDRVRAGEDVSMKVADLKRWIA